MNFGEDLSLQVMQVNKSYQQYLSRALKEIDIYQHYQIILLISRAGGRTTQKAICETLKIEKSNMVPIITLLESKQYVTKEVNFKDRRGKLISLTPKANYLIGIMSNLFSVFEENMADDLTWQEMYNCLRVLGKVNDKLKNIALMDAGFDKMMKQIALLNNDQVLA
ncbi:MarR family winged helix-turn-helix transcriptional regulator [Mucilaginibacter xinganensis]|uniref:MarR family transcriptional regulator n=1 Tax=Mucilaginibacter xinganensis TaxID=1234841 RepID=A0A223NT37_9SPHI|nr:MarR family winged helix-turn-helix transcriptional regulator [Mucilaginibacter xinganensis]ASU33065.1 MarR family transcriptional regulator [Mucilaginibacter xinganensis]